MVKKWNHFLWDQEKDKDTHSHYFNSSSLEVLAIADKDEKDIKS